MPYDAIQDSVSCEYLPFPVGRPYSWCAPRGLEGSIEDERRVACKSAVTLNVSVTGFRTKIEAYGTIHLSR